ncbi:hypothetical protein BLL37_14620 [Pseudomonas azotoformans]|uniref:Uncharacterized protein n=1 Tax=Pseudomonas azotoformans TaxID=47878 RepID=A0A1V2JIQ7_PSEAZ|nr:hypothetical protein BFL39_20575 [Pseudomonas azotoformans]ONH44561.1 hypothetical protein BLL37_14620 [Pseudomonas azotoformans]
MGGLREWVEVSLSISRFFVVSGLVVVSQLVVVSGLAPRWAAQQPQNQTLRSTWHTAPIIDGAAAQPNAGQARSPQDSCQPQGTG